MLKGGEVAGFDNSQNVKNEPRLAAGRPREHLHAPILAATEFLVTRLIKKFGGTPRFRNSGNVEITATGRRPYLAARQNKRNGAVLVVMISAFAASLSGFCCSRWSNNGRLRVSARRRNRWRPRAVVASDKGNWPKCYFC